VPNLAAPRDSREFIAVEDAMAPKPNGGVSS
jgi:hypothetical protein